MSGVPARYPVGAVRGLSHHPGSSQAGPAQGSTLTRAERRRARERHRRRLYVAVAALVVVLPYYNERRPPGSRAKLVSTNIPRTLDGIRQGVLDCRCATTRICGDILSVFRQLARV